MDINFTAGDGAYRAVFIKGGAGAITNPTDATTYTASANFASPGTQLGSSGYYCVYKGTGSAVTVSGLTGGTQYYVQVFEFNGTAGNEYYNTYTATNNPNNRTTLSLPTNTIYVDASKTDDSGDGLSWANAKKTLQAALNIAVSGKDIWVKAGTYKPTSDYGWGTGINSRLFHFRMKNGVGIYGGFAGTETSVSQRTAFGVGQTNETILSGDVGTVGVSTDNCCHVFYHPDGSNLSSSAILDGFTVTKGNANNPLGSGYAWETCGGGMYNGPTSASITGTWAPTIRNTAFIDNSAISFGGAVYNLESSPTFTNVTVQNNTANIGGGVANSGSTTTFTNFIFSNNTSTQYGGGIVQES